MTVAAWSTTADVWAARSTQSLVPGFLSEIAYLESHPDEPDLAALLMDLALRVGHARTRAGRDSFELGAIAKRVTALPLSAAVQASVANSRSLIHTEYAGLLGLTSRLIDFTAPLPSRDSLLTGTYRPGPETTGVIESKLKYENFSSSVTYAENDLVIEDTVFYGKVSFTGKRQRAKNCLFYGSPTVATDCIGATNANLEDLVISDSTITAQAPQHNTAGLRGGGGTTFLRVNIFGVIDGIAFNQVNNVKVYGSWLHDLIYFSPDPGAAGGMPDNSGHLDLMQWRGGDNFDVWGNNLVGHMDTENYQGGELSVDLSNGDHVTGNKYTRSAGVPDNRATSCLMVSPALAPITNLYIHENWIDGGAVAINLSPTYLTNGPTDIRHVNNRYGRDMRLGPNATISGKNSLTIVNTGNVRIDNPAESCNYRVSAG